MDGNIESGDRVVCRVNGTHDFYVIGTVVSGTVGDLTLRSTTTTQGQAAALERAYQERMENRRVWLFDGAAGAYVKTSPPESSGAASQDPA